MKFYKPKFWDKKKPNLLALILLPLTIPLLANNLLRNFFKAKKSIDIIKICIGNIYVGGTGKTPLAIKSENIMNSSKLNSVIIKKFYKSQLDEQLLIKKYSKLICKKKRLDAVKEAKVKNFKYAIFDDGLQDNSIDYDIKIVCFNNIQWIGNGFLIPAGPLREKLDSIKKYDAIVINGDPRLNGDLINYIIFSGIGNPKNFLKILKENNLNISKEFIFPDHHNYTDNDLGDIINYSKTNNLKIITTEKDYFKINENFQKEMLYLKLKLKIFNEKKFLEFLTHKK